MESEDGINAGFRNIGRFFLAMIPWALAVGAMAWLATWVAFHEWQREERQAKRAAVYVGAPEPVKSKLKITSPHRSCLHVDRVDLDGKSLVIYGSAPSGCSGYHDYTVWHWQMLSPDGTILHQDYTNHMDLPEGAKAEQRMTVEEDDRASELQVWLTR